MKFIFGILIGIVVLSSAFLYAEEKTFTQLEKIDTEKFTYDSKNKRDPFVPLVTNEGKYLFGLGAKESIGDINLEGIVWDSQGIPIAIINGVIVKEGDQVGEFRVFKIEQDKLILKMNEKEYVIELIEE